MDGSIVVKNRTAAVARWATHATYKDFDAETITFTKALLLKTITGMLVGAREPIAKILSTYLISQGGVPDAGIVASGVRTTVENAAMANATFAHASELEDNELPSITSAYWMFPGLFPVAQKQFSTGKELIEAAIITWEVASRFCRAGPGFLYMFAHMCPPSWFGPLGVAAGTAKLLKLDEKRTEHAITMSGSYASGLGQAGCDVHFLESGHTVKMGIQSGYLAAAGATGELGILELPSSALYSPVASHGKVDLSVIDEHLGQAPWAINRACIKKYSACTYAHTTIDSLGLIMKEHHLGYDAIELVETTVSPVGKIAVGSKPNPIDLQEARFSLEYLLSEVMLKGGLSPDSFTDSATLDDADWNAAKAKVRVHLDNDLPYESTRAIVKVTAKGGKQYTQQLDSWLGSPAHPMSYEEIRKLCRPFMETMLSPTDCDRIEFLVGSLEKQPDVHEIMDILTFSRVGRR
jgi:2-methylcitrate dehydratase PrpD